MRSKGFTLFELVTVIVILGILAVTALPKYININQDAHDAVAKSVFSSYKTAVFLYHNCWLASGEQGYVTDLACFGSGDVDSSTAGFPLNTDSDSDIIPPSSGSGTVLTGDFCRQLWFGLIDSNDFVLALHTDASFGGDTGIIYWYSNADATLPTTHCYYNYITDNQAKGQENWQMKYFPNTGAVTIGRATLG